MNHYRLAAAPVTAIVVVLAVLVGIGAIMYFTSDVFSTKVDAGYNQFAHWTPENIAKDPENYLNFCEKQATKALDDLKVNEISLAQTRAKLDSMKEESTRKTAVGEKALAELKDTYQKADAAKSWPVTWQGQPRDAEALKRQIVLLHKQVTAEKNLQAKLQTGITKMETQVGRIQEARGQAQGQLAEIRGSREILKVQKITDDLTKKLVDFRSAIQTTVSSVAETSGVVSLDQLASESVGSVSDAEFDQIMKGSAATQPK
jgi:hypothetical protein